MRLPLFPLDLLVLPGGLSQLRIFEPRYLRLVSIASEEAKGFVLCQPSNEDFPQFNIGVHCIIEDFEQLEDGMLGITIRGLERVELSDTNQADDKLYSALTKKKPAWSLEQANPIEDDLSEKLQQVLVQHSLYEQHPDFFAYDDESWVVSRWLELLPFSSNAKNQILNEDDFNTLDNLVHQLVSEITIDAR
ncbi:MULTISPECIES: LON peptidase substrate-binding domain-containing protein [unclassified Agarivorans]|uniref:LON peptidase substrate-binding domain-containing protein n=1 Tax=unclassified Agarivorans TaxID=2636026 RepID=UPI0026E13220|nr:MULTISPECIES: LON peptidase substrate-binding domain-containing protein [unclassified Agarivorans]MDO6684954.1 LON peptidase substrate-binding domain-containing protein [Agarivorans sp. 3_MG-2023]MDO6714885.1 LON peptidase substrate-binding domain-containing protein [Agarivorans sp. 2_MG-2023]